MAPEAEEYVVDFPTLWIVPDWIERHCLMPSAMAEPSPLEMYDWQLWCTVNHYRVKPDALPAGTRKRDGSLVSVAAAFQNRRSQVVAVQKVGKGPWSASIICAEAVGPVTFCGFAEGGETYRCSEYGCGCGWEYEYAPGEPMGKPWVRPLIQLLATSEEQTDNIYAPLQTMIRSGALGDLMRVGEGFIRCPNDGRVDTVTAKAQSKLGNPITFAMQDETGLYTQTNGVLRVAQTQRRGAAGMGGRSMETTNPWDPAENSTAQQTYESRRPDIFRFYRHPPAHLSFKNKEDRRKILRYCYRGSLHVDLDSIEAEAAELLETDPAQAERFYGGRLVQGMGSWLPDGLWAAGERREGIPWEEKPAPEAGTPVSLGFDGSDSDDWTGIRLRTRDGYRFTPTYGPDKRPAAWNPAEWGGSIPRGEVHAAMDEICARYKVKRAYCDPRDWASEIGDWALRYGQDVFLEWATYRVVQMHEALVRAVTDLKTGRSTHDGCPITTLHVANARKIAKPGDRYILSKPHGAYHQKIDMAMADVLAHEAGEDALADGWGAPEPTNYFYSA
jgi:hypothetical protein